MAVQPSPAPNPNLVLLGNIISDCLKRLFTAQRAITGLKLAAFTAFLAFLAWGVKVIAGGNYDEAAGARGGLSFEMTSPDLAQCIFGFLAFVFVIGANIYVRQKRQQHELKLLDFASRPGTHPDMVKTILSQL